MLKSVKDLEIRKSYPHLWGMKINNTILYDKRHRAQPMKVKRNSKRKASDSQHKVDALVNWVLTPHRGVDTARPLRGKGYLPTRGTPRGTQSQARS